MTTLKDLLEPGTGRTMTPRRALRAVGHYLDREAPGPEALATVVFGIPVYVDPAMPPGTVELRTSTQTARAVNIGDGPDPHAGSDAGRGGA